ncbi:hypothetical protein QAD02_002087 [Eretmocerus hayati]|uniref:Uncharacterized protein n=1 Tax=Eretmocerus hayati TaxID=131215 RepID=A0ACC2NIW0_9HYME|nr:hypothetical protein QAD02_002087 [Eretmocerus hayati]
MMYFTDGAAQHFKNRYDFQNSIHHRDDFSIIAECHFNATVHGKNVCDGLGANLKFNARRASMQSISGNQITTPYELYVWARQAMKTMDVFFVSKDEYLQTKTSFLEGQEEEDREHPAESLHTRQGKPSPAEEIQGTVNSRQSLRFS